MKLKQAGMACLSLVFGCVRIGYDVPNGARDSGADAAAAGMDAAITGHDASVPPAIDAAAADANVVPRDAGSARDASTARDAGIARDASSQRDAAALSDASNANDAGRTDAGATDAAASGKAPCSFAITENRYDGKKHYHGYLTLQNTGTTTWTLPVISLDLPATANICNDEAVLPGAGWTLLSSAGHCEYTKTVPPR